MSHGPLSMSIRGVAVTALVVAGCLTSAPAARLALGTGRDDAGLTGIATSFQRGDAIAAAVWRPVAFGFPAVKLRLFRLQPEPIEKVWDDSYVVDRDSTVLYLSLPTLEPAAYRLVAYLAMTEPLASADFAITP